MEVVIMADEQDVLTIKLDPDFKENIKELADRNHLSMSAFVRFLLQREIDDLAQRKDFGDDKNNC